MTVTIKVMSNIGIVRELDVEGFRVGDWMVHRIPNLGAEPIPTRGHGWRVSHVCGASIANLADDLTRKDAERVAKALADALQDFPSEISASDVLCSEWVREWRHLAQAVVAEALVGGRHAR